MSKKDKLIERAAKIQSRLDEIEKSADARDDVVFTEDERTEYDQLVVDLKDVSQDVERLDARDAAQIRDWAQRRNVTAPGQFADRGVDGDSDDDFDDGARIVSLESDDGPFRQMGDQLAAIALAASPGGDVDERLYKVAGPTGASAQIGGDAGYLMQRDFTTALMGAAHDTGVLASKCDRIPIGPGSQGIEAPMINETSRANGQRWGGVQVYRPAEAETVAASRPKFDKMTIDLEDMMGLAYATERALQDATSLGAIFRQAFGEEFGFKLDDEIWSGNGAGQCLGIMNSGALTTVAKEGSQVADTIVAANIVKMFARAYRVSQAEWFITAQAWEQLPLMTIGDQPIYQPPAGLASAPLGTLLGRPINIIEHAEKLGDLGDISLLNLGQYALIEKGGLTGDESIHVRFIYNERTFRWVTRTNGAPKWKTALTPYKANSGFTVSPFVVLAARA